MKETIKRWLARQLAGVESVRACGFGREADLVAVTWSASIIHIYLLDSPAKTRMLKKIVSENTRIGIGTLFIIDAALAPADGSRLTPDDGLIALHALFRDKFYTYRMNGDQPSIGQVHFKSFGRGDEREVWYGPDIAVHHLPYYKISVRHPNSVKGEWLMATLGSEAFWKQADYSAGRDAFRKQVHEGQTRTYSWSRDTFGDAHMHDQAEAPPRPAPVRMTRLDTSLAQLGLARGADSEQVKAAFRKMARELHPDVSTLPKEEAEHQFRKVSEAYAFIKLTMGW
ncbi:MAG: J domain-containing protein [Pleurocapsa minor GSE-CHR-MK-17-07R]|jgi:hypothetical protein|nr:J domain-containing protein [Pleurocapsa minor GSE-CHR-MK 17-07R]